MEVVVYLLGTVVFQQIIYCCLLGENCCFSSGCSRCFAGNCGFPTHNCCLPGDNCCLSVECSHLSTGNCDFCTYNCFLLWVTVVFLLEVVVYVLGTVVFQQITVICILITVVSAESSCLSVVNCWFPTL